MDESELEEGDKHCGGLLEGVEQIELYEKMDECGCCLVFFEQLKILPIFLTVGTHTCLIVSNLFSLIWSLWEPSPSAKPSP